MMRIRQVEYIRDYKLKLKFSDQSIKIVDLENLINKSKGIFLPLKDLNYFKQVDLDDCQLSICWPNGADICPDILYEIGKDVQEKKKLTTHRIGQKKQGSIKTAQIKRQPAYALAKKKSKKKS